jgi:hypothetical protein
MKRMISSLARACAALAAAAGLLLGAQARAASVLPLYLDEMADTAAVAFEGRCLANRSDVDTATGLVVTYTTFEVRDVLKGSVGATHEIKQVGGALPGDGPQYRVMGVPRFEVGEDYVVFLAGVSTAGFSSPIGLAQGRFKVDKQGEVRKVRNGRDFRDMTRRMLAKVPSAARAQMEKSDKPVRDMDLEEFKQLVRGHLGTKR